ncbi:MAG: hypothetical protein A2Z95_03570 [Gallionellales bacterium GWA2_60_18]|nr:MAG: hypothetical protein A2Z95_03570 [Gallionellales bacterium GWA2_60_18]
MPDNGSRLASKKPRDAGLFAFLACLAIAKLQKLRLQRKQVAKLIQVLLTTTNLKVSLRRKQVAKTLKEFLAPT